MQTDRSRSELFPEYVEIETSTYCNRSCGWCPNSLHDRSKTQRLMPAELFEKIAGDMASFGYSGITALHNYNEPLYDPLLCQRIAMTRAATPAARIYILTNGDVLTPAICTEMEELGVDLLRISVYSGTPEGRAHALGFTGTAERDEFGSRLEAEKDGMRVVFYKPDTARFTSRGGTVREHVSGGNICALPLTSAAIDVDGNMKICCEIYSADDAHRRDGMIGNLASDSFLDLWFSDRYNKLRIGLMNGNAENPVCRRCDLKPKHASDGYRKIDAWMQALAK